MSLVFKPRQVLPFLFGMERREDDVCWMASSLTAIQIHNNSNNNIIIHTLCDELLRKELSQFQFNILRWNKLKVDTPWGKLGNLIYTCEDYI